MGFHRANSPVALRSCAP